MESKIRVYSGSLCFQFYINDRERPSDIKVTRDRKERKGKRGWRRGGEEREREKKGKPGNAGEYEERRLKIQTRDSTNRKIIRRESIKRRKISEPETSKHESTRKKTHARLVRRGYS